MDRLEVQAALQAQGKRLHPQDEQLTLLCQDMRDITGRQETSFSSQLGYLVGISHQLQSSVVSIWSSSQPPTRWTELLA